MSLAPSFRFLALVDSRGTEGPEVLSFGQIVRVAAVMALLGSAIIILSLPPLLGN